MVENRRDAGALRILFALTALVTAARMIWAQGLELAPDEAYYWAWSRQLTLAYRDHPPLIAWVASSIPTALGAASELWVRLPALASGLVLPPALYALVRAAGAGPSVALPASLAGALCPLASAGAVILTPDSLLGVTWIACLACAAGFARGGSRVLILASASTAALAVLSKLTGVLALPVLTAAALARREPVHRWLWHALAGAVVLAAALAVVAAAETRLVTGPVSFQLARLAEASLRPLGPLEFVAAQVGLVGVLPALGVAALVARRGAGMDPARRLLSWGFWPAFGILLALSCVIHVEMNWAAVALPSVCAGWALVLERIRARSARRGLTLAWTSAALSAALSLLLHLHAAGILAPSVVGRGPASRLHGWSTLARVVRDGAPRGLVTDDYELWAALRYYGGPQLSIRLVDPGRLPPCPRPDLLLRVADTRLGLVREVTGCLLPSGSAAIRSAGR